MYLKDDHKRRIKFTWEQANSEVMGEKSKYSVWDIFEIAELDPKYEAEWDEKELRIALEKENQFEPYQTDLF